MDIFFIAQIVGFFGLALQFSGYVLLKKPSQILILQSFAAIPWVTHFLLLGMPSVAIVIFFIGVRNILSALLPIKILKEFIAIFIAILSVYFIQTSNSFVDFVPLFAIFCGSFACFNRDHKMKFFTANLLGCTIWVFIHAFAGSIPGLINQVFIWCGIIMALTRVLKEHKSNLPREDVLLPS